MAIKTQEEIKKIRGSEIITGYAIDDKKPSEKILVYKINKNKTTIEYFPLKSKYYFFTKISIDGFSSLPEIFKKNGYCKNRIFDYIHRTFNGKKIKSIDISKTGACSITKKGKNKYLHLTYSCLDGLSDELGTMDYYHRQRRAQVVNKLFNTQFPKLVKARKINSAAADTKLAIQTLSAQGVDSFDKHDIGRVTDIVSTLMKSSHRLQITQSDLFKNTKLKIDSVTFSDVIDRFDKKLSSKRTSESEWGKFLEENLFLIDSKYIHSIAQLNLILGTTRKVDFGLVDTQGYLDLFEIKKPETKLLVPKKDSRGNYSWDKQAIEAIVQAEKYLYHAERKGSDLKADIKREKDIDLDVIRPRAFVIMGNSTQLDTPAKKEDFRILKNQFKNIEIVLYDELLERIKNQKKSLES